MRAPCGVEIEVGQVWEGWPNGEHMTMEITGFEEMGSVVSVQWADGINDAQPLEQFRGGNRGGYRLVRQPK